MTEVHWGSRTHQPLIVSKEQLEEHAARESESVGS